MTTLINLITEILAEVARGDHATRFAVAKAVFDRNFEKEGTLYQPGSIEAVFTYLQAQGLIIDDEYGRYALAEQNPLGFHLNQAGQRPDRRIVYGSATAAEGGAGPAVSIHLFFSVEEAKELVNQLLVALAKAEVANDD